MWSSECSRESRDLPGSGFCHAVPVTPIEVLYFLSAGKHGWSSISPVGVDVDTLPSVFSEALEVLQVMPDTRMALPFLWTSGDLGRNGVTRRCRCWPASRSSWPSGRLTALEASSPTHFLQAQVISLNGGKTLVNKRYTLSSRCPSIWAWSA